MELINDFEVHVPIDEAWRVLTDVERIAPCMPGAQLQEIEGDTYRGIVKIKVGPITAQFKGQASFVERDDQNHRAVLKAEGRDTAGKGNAAAMITAKLEPVSANTTKCTVTTDLTITGKVAQFGRGALADVSTKLLGQFVDCLHNDLLAGKEEPASSAEVAEPSPAAPAEEAPSAGVRKVEMPEAKPVDLLEAAGAPVAKRLLPVGIVALLLLVLLGRRRRRRRRLAAG
jgi:carbon monoxide dehydrogenase subunit G